MSETAVEVTDSVLDELVAGNLKGEPYRQVLRSLEGQPDGWKRCALAFLQEQALTHDLQAIAANELRWSAANNSARMNPVRRIAGCSAGGEIAIFQTPGHSRMERITKLTSLAAMLLISFTVGWFGSGLGDLRWNQQGLTARGQTTTIPERSGTVTQAASAADRSIDSTNASVYSEAGSLVEVDSANFHYAGEEVIPLASEPPYILQELHRSGRIDLESFDAVLPVVEGDTLRLVPVQHYRVRQKVFSY